MGSPNDAPPPIADATTDDRMQEERQTPPTFISPPRSKTPPTVIGKRSHSGRRAERVDRSGSEPHVEEAGQPRSSTPSGSPSRKRQKVQNASDRFIPNRAGQDLQASYSLLHDDGSPATPSRSHKRAPSELHFQKKEANRTYSNLLRSEMFDREVPQTLPQDHEGPGTRATTPPVAGSVLKGPHLTPSTPHKNLFSYAAHPTPSLTPRSTSRSDRGPNLNARSDLYSLSPVKHASQTMLLSPRKTPRAVSKVPYKVLDAPELQDDFYLNLVDWGANDILAVGLGASVYLWSRETGTVKQLCQLEGDTVTSVSWIQRGSHLAIGTNKGLLLIYDTVAERRLRTMTGHSARLSSLAWNAHILSTGSRDRTILHRDVRLPAPYLRRLTGHRQEVCGLKWNPDTEQLASGGNDNKIFVWERMEERWLHRWGEQEGGHKAAVKAIAWSPHQRGLLASGGGTADRCIKFWNTVAQARTAGGGGGGLGSATMSGFPAADTPASLGLGLSSTAVSPLLDTPSTPFHPTLAHTDSGPANPHLLSSHDTGSQVCNLLFSSLTSELVSTHGYSQHAIHVWRYPSMRPVVTLTGHTYRVLYLAMHPGGEVIVTGAGDETLRFWDVFGKGAQAGRGGGGGGGRGGGLGGGGISFGGGTAGGGKRGGIVGEWGVIR
ncbi:substrate-specific activator of APC-dependent proteolysis [Teratosphaeriaceae sp. CCFEE 6253]|nr:substrate-specific activator of APC-dependent proteolysis [Teratosphaeriaceae sp. CCFEE 6253]